MAGAVQGRSSSLADEPPDVSGCATGEGSVGDAGRDLRGFGTLGGYLCGKSLIPNASVRVGCSA